MYGHIHNRGLHKIRQLGEKFQPINESLYIGNTVLSKPQNTSFHDIKAWMIGLLCGQPDDNMAGALGYTHSLRNILDHDHRIRENHQSYKGQE
jgi:hypothetical protein